MNEAFKIHFYEINKKNIDLFHSKDKRVGSKRFNEERDWLEKEIVRFKKYGDNDYPERFDLRVFTFNHNKKPWLLTDGSHRTQSLKRLLDRGEIDTFDIILIPDILIPTRDTFEHQGELYEEIDKQSRALDKMLIEEELPTWIKKFDCALQRDGTYLLWANVKAINSGGKDMTMLSIPEYQKTREQQPK